MKNIKMTPMEAFESVQWAALFLDRYNPRGSKGKVVGAPVLEAKPATRELLKQLKSEDLANIRPDVIFGVRRNKQ